ncbi:hypothetical protein [uncultured Clostridium sp.]|nr:hypothetical protein [uncultured Clostridium sp.]
MNKRSSEVFDRMLENIKILNASKYFIKLYKSIGDLENNEENVKA